MNFHMYRDEINHENDPTAIGLWKYSLASSILIMGH